MSDLALYGLLIVINLLVFGGPIVSALLKHQKEMAQIYRVQAASNDELRQIREEIRELKLVVLRQSLPDQHRRAESL